ncbi:MAG: M15 family metallopeptidase [Ruminococcus sp.]|uniref:D-Ala-D-Ala carboxypeptidase n=1 Tax=Ruminococcus albus SY3 TaxID=1341156 RepID=A0A011UWZ4_RUMAL|nr:M15 family metallopeptidase [Ruminococcus albus]EXM37732.1 D-Ala-D-Ala carboxypeptidase [Ruminococcus albus SY3]MBP5268381.1 M15 family metallopeptidase [Ruminococcus sp.]
MDYLILVNRFEPIPAGWSDTLKLREAGGKLFEEQTAVQLEKMLGEALAYGIEIAVISGYRSEDYQQMLWEKEISRNMGRGLDYADAVTETGKTLALPGCSEHGTGLAADLGTAGADDIDPNFHKTAAGKWLSQNAGKFGFILRYPRMKEHITGIDFEPWHYRYVGDKSAELITASGICLEEFLHFYSDKYTLC